MKILITGANGLIGSFLSKKYASLGHSVIGIDNFCNSDKELVSAEEDGYTLYEADVADLSAMFQYCEGIDVIFHTACKPYEGFSNVSPYEVSTSVFNSTVSVATAAAKHKIKQIFNFSSMARYGNNENLPFLEDMVPTPSDPYGTAKVAAENMLNTMSKIYGFKVVHLIPHNVFGCRAKWDDPRRGVLSIFANQALQDLPITIHNTGEQKRSFSFVEDAFSFAEELLSYDFKNGDVLNVGPDEPETYLSVNEIADIVLEETKSKSERVYIKKINDVHEAWCSSDKIRSIFHWESKADIRTEIRKIISFIKEHGVKPFSYDYSIEIEEMCPRNWLLNKK